MDCGGGGEVVGVGCGDCYLWGRGVWEGDGGCELSLCVDCGVCGDYLVVYFEGDLRAVEGRIIFSGQGEGFSWAGCGGFGCELGVLGCFYRCCGLVCAVGCLDGVCTRGEGGDDDLGGEGSGGGRLCLGFCGARYAVYGYVS